MEQGFQGTIIRVKRKRNEEPLDALTVLASTTANRPQALASKSKKGRGFKSLSLESSTDEAPGQEAAAASGASEATSAAASSESTSNQGSAAAEDDDGGGTAPLVFRLMDTIGLRDSSTQAARLKRGIRRAHRASRVNKDSASDAGTEKAAAQELAVGAQEKLRESSKAGRSQAKQAIFDKRRSKVPSSIGSSLAEEEEFVDEGAEPSHATPQTHEATDAGTLSSSEQAAAPEVPTISSKVPSGSPFRPVFKPPPKKPSAARKPAASQPTAEGRSGRGSGSGYSASLGLPASASSFHMVDVQVPPKPKKRVLAEPPPADASQPPRIALNGQPMHAIKATESNRAASKSAASPASASASASPSTKMTPAAAAAGVSPSKSIPTRVLNPWESRMDQAIFAAFQSGVDASGVARALDACSGAHSSRVIQVANLVRPADGTTPLMAAGWCGDELLCARLLKLGADPLVVDAHGATAEQLCLRRGAAQAGGVVKKAAHAAQAARDDAEYVYDVYVLDLLGTAQERWKAQVTASGGGVAVGGENGMSENEDDNSSSSSSSSASALKQQQRMAEVALPEPLRVTRRELSALNRLRNSGRNNDPYGGGEYGGDWSDENDDDDDGLAWSDDGANDSHGDESEDSNDEAAEGNDYPDEEDDPFEAGFGEETPPPSSDEDVVATGMVRGGLAFGLDHSDNDDDDDEDSDRDDTRQVMPQRHAALGAPFGAPFGAPSTSDSSSSSGNHSGFLFPSTGGEEVASSSMFPGAPSSGMATDDVDLSRPITFDEAFPAGIYPVTSPSPADLSSATGVPAQPVATLNGFSNFITSRPASNTEVVDLSESDSD